MNTAKSAELIVEAIANNVVFLALKQIEGVRRSLRRFKP
jgi:hypothetical protein